MSAFGGLEVWRKIHGDPELIDGLTLGDIEDVAAAVTAVLEDVRREIPFGLARRIDAAAATGQPADLLGAFKELARLPAVRAVLDALSGREELS